MIVTMNVMNLIRKAIGTIVSNTRSKQFFTVLLVITYNNMSAYKVSMAKTNGREYPYSVVIIIKKSRNNEICATTVYMFFTV
jgi:hypothetical protein